MATYHAVPAVGGAIISLLRAAPRPSEYADAEFALFRTEDFERPIANGVSVYLYRIADVYMSRTQPPQLGPDGSRRRPPLSLSLHYLLTGWGSDAGFEQQLLAWSMRVLEDMPVLSHMLLNETSAGAFSEGETVELILEDLPLAEVVGLWRGLRHRYRPGVSYAARVIAIDSNITIGTGAGEHKSD